MLCIGFYLVIKKSICKLDKAFFTFFFFGESHNKKLGMLKVGKKLCEQWVQIKIRNRFWLKFCSKIFENTCVNELS